MNLMVRIRVKVNFTVRVWGKLSLLWLGFREKM